MAGCIENMSDLKDRIQGTSTPDEVVNETLDDLDTPTNGTKNVTKTLRPPVARITVFAEGGALVYKASFVAENVTATPVMAEGGVLTFNAADSEAVQGGAELKKFEWTIAGKKMEGRKVEANLSEAGIHMVALKVTDSLGSADEQMIHIGIPPTPFTETVEFSGGPIADVEASGASPIGSASHAFTVLSEKDGKPLQVQSLEVTLTFAPTADMKFTLVDPEGTETTVDDGFVGASDGTTESILLTGAAAGEWSAVVAAYTGVSDAYTLTVAVTYVEIVEGLGDGHGHAGH